MSTEIRYFENRKDWRKWLADNFDTADGVWFVFPTKSSSEKSIVYNDAVEEALCFGWIDSTIKSLDKEHKIQRFTPRNPKSTYSQANKERLKWLLEHKMIHLEFEDKIRTVLSVPFVFPNDIIDRLKEDERIWKNYQSFSDPYKRIRIAYIEAARKRPEEFEKRLNNFICKVKELPTDIECRSVKMCRVWRSIAVTAAQAFYVVLGAEYGSHNYLVWIQPLGGQ